VDPRLVLFAGLLAGALAMAWVPRALRRAKLAARFSRSRRLEAGAAQVLAAAGYTVLDTQVTAPCRVTEDGAPVDADLRADYLVERRGRIFVAEAKSGPRATDLRERGTRRQLLEYATTYDVDGVLLVDMEAERVVEVAFPALARRTARAFWSGLLLGVVVGLAAALVWSYRSR
jgi:hypothetical protein